MIYHLASWIELVHWLGLNQKQYWLFTGYIFSKQVLSTFDPFYTFQNTKEQKKPKAHWTKGVFCTVSTNRGTKLWKLDGTTMRSLVIPSCHQRSKKVGKLAAEKGLHFHHHFCHLLLKDKKWQYWCDERAFSVTSKQWRFWNHNGVTMSHKIVTAKQMLNCQTEYCDF